MTRSRLLSDNEADNFVNWNAPQVAGDISHLPTAGQIEALHKQAYNEAYEQGLSEGKKSGFEQGYHEAQVRFNEQAGKMDSILNVLSDPIKEFDNQLEECILELSLIIARHIIRRELKSEPGEIIAVVREAMDVLPMNNQIAKIYLHPEDAKLVREVLMLDSDNTRWQLYEEHTLARGDCRLETGDSRIDATVENRLSAIASKLMGEQRNSDESVVVTPGNEP